MSSLWNVPSPALLPALFHADVRTGPDGDSIACTMFAADSGLPTVARPPSHHVQSLGLHGRLPLPGPRLVAVVLATAICPMRASRSQMALPNAAPASRDQR
jgi:hypothetical protein